MADDSAGGAPAPEWLTQRSRETRVLAARGKRVMLEAAQEEGEIPSAAELLQMDRLEAKLAARERVERVREATRIRGAGRP